MGSVGSGGPEGFSTTKHAVSIQCATILLAENAFVHAIMCNTAQQQELPDQITTRLYDRAESQGLREAGNRLPYTLRQAS